MDSVKDELDYNNILTLTVSALLSILRQLVPINTTLKSLSAS